MGGIHYDRRARITPGWRLGIGIAGAALVAVCVIGLRLPDTAASPAVRVSARCCVEPVLAPRPVDPRQADRPAAAPPARSTAEAADVDGRRSYRAAQLYADCRRASEAPPPVAAEGTDERYEIDPSGGFAAAIDHAERQAREACREVGPAEYRQVDALMRESARRGNVDARFHFVRQAVAALLQHQDDDPAACVDGAAALADVEQLAARGQPSAIELAGQLLASGRIVAPDPVRAAAWGLVGERQSRGQTLTSEQIDGSGVLSALADSAQAQQALLLAETLPSGGRLSTSPSCPARDLGMSAASDSNAPSDPP